MNVIEDTEKNFAKFIGVKYAHLVNSGTSALLTAYLACGIGPGDEVIVPSYTYYATANMVLAAGATPVFADINGGNTLVNVKDILLKITDKTKAVVVVNLFGEELEIDDFCFLYDYLTEKKIFLIIDAAQCCKPNIGHGDINCFSFYRSKNFSCFEGGAVTTENIELDKKMRTISNNGEDYKYHTMCLGYNFRISDLQAVMINHQFMYHFIGGKAELGRFNPKSGHYPYVVFEQPLYKNLGYYDKWKGKCPNAESLALEVREKYFKL